MTLDKNENLSQIDEIEFNWERVVERANLKMDRLIQNSPKVVTREIGRTSTTDERIEPEIMDSTSNKHYPITSSASQVVPDATSDDSPDRNVIQLVKLIKEEKLSGKDLTIDERRIVVNSLRLAGQTQDAIADLLNISRRTIVNDYKFMTKNHSTIGSKISI